MTSAGPDLDRRIVFETVFNVRDLGGLSTADGHRIRSGQVFRADGVHRLRDADVEVARGLGLRTVLDLRTDLEVEHRGRFPVDELAVDWYHLPFLTRPWSEDGLKASATTAVEFLTERYLDMLESGAGSLVRALEVIADGTPALFHCAAGKDRTGVLAAVLLGLCGVEGEVIAADYHLSSAAMADFSRWLQVEFPEAADAMSDQPREYLECPPEAMLGFLAGVAERFGSMSGLTRHLGVDDATVAQVRATLVEP